MPKMKLKMRCTGTCRTLARRCISRLSKAAAFKIPFVVQVNGLLSSLEWLVSKMRQQTSLMNSKPILPPLIGSREVFESETSRDQACMGLFAVRLISCESRGRFWSYKSLCPPCEAQRCFEQALDMCGANQVPFHSLVTCRLLTGLLAEPLHDPAGRRSRAFGRKRTPSAGGSRAMAPRLLALSGEEIEVELADAQSMKDVHLAAKGALWRLSSTYR